MAQRKGTLCVFLACAWEWCRVSTTSAMFASHSTCSALVFSTSSYVLFLNIHLLPRCSECSDLCFAVVFGFIKYSMGLWKIHGSLFLLNRRACTERKTDLWKIFLASLLAPTKRLGLSCVCCSNRYVQFWNLFNPQNNAVKVILRARSRYTWVYGSNARYELQAICGNRIRTFPGMIWTSGVRPNSHVCK
jgi:hypothetical protein